MDLPIGVSNRHVHLSVEDAEKLYGAGYELTKIKELSQPGQYAAEECLTLKGPKGEISKVRILGPYRKESQVEILMADQFKLGTMAPIRLSGDLEGSAPIELIADNGNSIQLEEGMIIAKRHVHMTPADAETYGVKDGEIIKVKCDGERGLFFDEVVVRVTNSSALDLHIDTEEANAAGLKNGSRVELVK